ncbi:MAG: tyrosine-type recombinase/integrase, partial [Verrucomicrobia bacterium]|nr:tyrosine-type recombinase/integrase [Verrucomicrobiota bacterium]
DSNLADQVDHPDVDETTPEIWTVEEAERLLSNANEFGLLPYVAIGLFAGVRTTEMLRMDSKAINFETKTITIAPGVAKKRSQRTIEMQPALLAWLAPFKETLQTGGKFVEAGKLARNKEKLLEAARIPEWKANGLRHSFGTYHFTSFQNDDSTSFQMGNSPQVMHKHYKALATKETAEKFWSLRPETQTPMPEAPQPERAIVAPTMRDSANPAQENTLASPLSSPVA